MTPAEKACRHIIQRCITSRNFSHLMVGTESLYLCFESESLRKGTSVAEEEAELLLAIKTEDAAQVARGESIEPDVVRLREEVERLSDDLKHRCEDLSDYARHDEQFQEHVDILARLENFIKDCELSVVSCFP